MNGDIGRQRTRTIPRDLPSSPRMSGQYMGFGHALNFFQTIALCRIYQFESFGCHVKDAEISIDAGQNPGIATLR